MHVTLQATVDKHTCQHVFKKSADWWRLLNDRPSHIDRLALQTLHDVSHSLFIHQIIKHPPHTHTSQTHTLASIFSTNSERGCVIRCLLCKQKGSEQTPEGAIGTSPPERILINMQGNPTIISDSHPKAAVPRGGPYNLKTRSS